MAENSENTVAMVSKQIETLRENLKYLETIEEKLKLKKQRQLEKMDSQNNDIETKYNRIEEMKIEFENKEKRLLKDKQELESYKLQIADQVTTKK